MEKVWEVAPRKFDDLIDQLLYNRGVIFDEPDDNLKKIFFDPDYDTDLYDPFLMKNMERAVSRIKKASKNGEKIGIFSDYDADGIPGAALMYRALNALNIPCEVFIPNRENGYGLSKEGIDYLVSKKCSLIITIDMAIRNFLEAIYCQEIGIDLIITDHHLPDEDVPSCFAVINPKQKGDKYPFKELCGCAVAYKLICGLAKVFPEKLDEKFLKWNLDLVAISTIADVVPLCSENRVLAKYGLIVMRKTQNLGLQELIKIAGIDAGLIGAYHVGFQIAPRINAPGRIDHATKSFELLVSDDPTEARELAKWLNEKNEDRQASMDIAEKEAVEEIEKDRLDQNNIIIVAGKWQKGIIGPTASRLVEKYGRPVILFSKGESVFTGSARSVSGVNIVSLFEKAKSLILKFGGHKGAAGLSVTSDKFQDFCDKMLEIGKKEISGNDLVKRVKVDANVFLSEMTFKLLDIISKFEPLGMGNSRPIFATSNISFENFRFVGKKNDHFSAISKDNNTKIKSIFFSFPYDKGMINYDKVYDIVFSLNQDEWNGQKNLSLNIVDLKQNG